METNQIKKFAIEARNILKTGVLNKISSLGFDAHGRVDERNKPQKVQPGAIFMGAHIADDTFYDKWMSLHERIQQKGVKEICEEAAYTWFNRLMAIRIMQKNGFISPMLAYESEAVHIPHIVAEARRGILPTMTEDNRRTLLAYLEDDSKVTEQFTSLVIAFCQFSPVLKACFGGVNDYTELLLPKNILAEGGFIDLLNRTEFITEEDYCSPELIGWLYQFYISEKKDEVFASFKNAKKAEAEDIPAATQIFTPNWIVKYMVQNTVGRIYLDNNPYSGLSEQMKYLVESSAPTPAEAKLAIADVETMKMIDPACGSGHILIEAFELFFQIYQEEGHSRRQAIEAILTKNILGIDLDTRAKQLAMFALLMAACKKDSSFLEANVLPRVLDMSGVPALYTGMKGDISDLLLSRDEMVLTEIMDAMELLQQAENLGSIMKFSISEVTRETIVRRLTEYETMAEMPVAVKMFLPAFRLVLALTDKYAAVVANPPYMGASNMNAGLAKYVKDEYEEGKADLFAVFMYVAMSLLIPKGKMGMINMQSWMFLSSFEKLRKHLITSYQIDSMLHLGPRTFDELSGEVVQNTAFVFCNTLPLTSGIYYRLIEGKNCAEKECIFLHEENRFTVISQEDFEKIPGNPIGYWISKKLINAFNNSTISSAAFTREGMTTADNDSFLRLWHEVSYSRIGLNKDREGAITSQMKWFPYAKGGGYKKWFGNQEYIVNWENDGLRIQNYKNPLTGRIRSHNYNLDFIFKPCLSWSRMNSNKFSIRYYPKGFLCDTTGTALYAKDNLEYYLAFLSSNIANYILNLFNPTIVIQSGDVAKLPLKYNNIDVINNICDKNISISKLDWDSHETSWDFQLNPLIQSRRDFLYDEEIQFATVISENDIVINEDKDKVIDYKLAFANQIEVAYNTWQSTWWQNFMRLHRNEEDLNRQFIEIYGLQDELTPDVPLSEITILQQGEITIKDNEVTFNKDVVMKQFISYAVGCWMGRYRLDRPGLQIAHPNPTEEETTPYLYNNESFVIDDDAIIPLVPRDCAFDDNALNRFTDFVRITFGTASLTQNLNFIEASLGKTIEDYFIKDFWKDHKRMYQNRPIYWLFASKKGAFQCITYMHRMDAYTTEKIRNKYLLPHIEYLFNRITEMDNRAASLSTQERKKLDNLRKDLTECQEYHDRLHAVADEQISFDLDDGVIVNYTKFGDVVAKIK